MSLDQTSNSVNFGDMGHMIYVSHVTFDAETESAIRIDVSHLDQEIDS
jgi:hypothetical protein